MHTLPDAKSEPVEDGPVPLGYAVHGPRVRPAVKGLGVVSLPLALIEAICVPSAASDGRLPRVAERQSLPAVPRYARSQCS